MWNPIRDWRDSRWYLWFGKWWMVQCCLDGGLSLGVHIDLRCRRTGKTNQRYGPYIDLHVLCFIISIGVNPVYSGDLDALASYSRGGRNAEDF